MIIITASGRFTKDADLRFTASGTAVLNFTLATDVGFGDSKHPVFIGCSLFGKRAESLAPHILKGGAATVSGNGDLRTWESNNKHGAEVTINVQDVDLQGSSQKPAQADSGGFRKPPPTRPKPAAPDEDPGYDPNDPPF